MSASNLSAKQLAMFMTPEEIVKNTKQTDADYYGGWNQMRDIKQRENESSGLDAAIKEHGVQKPLHLYHTSQAEGGHVEMTDGHHRLIAALKHHPDRLLPVYHSDDNDMLGGHIKGLSDNDWAIRKRVNLGGEDKW